MSSYPAPNAPVQAEWNKSRLVKPAGMVAWAEHVKAWEVYAARFGRNQSAERIAERGGFGFTELTEFLGHEPTTWRPR